MQENLKLTDAAVRQEQRATKLLNVVIGCHKEAKVKADEYYSGLWGNISYAFFGNVNRKREEYNDSCLKEKLPTIILD